MTEIGVGYLLKNINDKMKVSADADLKRFDLTFAQSQVFVFLNDCGGQATQKEIEVFLKVAHPTVVGIIARLEQKGFVATWPATDRRNKNVKLTPRAEAVGIDMERSIIAHEEKLLDSLSDEDVKKLKDMLMTIYSNLD